MAPRADAARNAEALLAAARELVDEYGPEVALDQVARRAGVGNATLYRHFPTRADLLIAVYEDEVAALCAKGEALQTASSESDALFAWLELLIEHIATKRTLAFSAAERQPDRRTALFDRWHESIRSVTARLLDHATEAGAVHKDLYLDDLLALTTGAATTADGTAQAQRMIRIISNGLKPNPTEP
jgi:AcrR family transcriptional regulator